MGADTRTTRITPLITLIHIIRTTRASTLGGRIIATTITRIITGITGTMDMVAGMVMAGGMADMVAGTVDIGAAAAFMFLPAPAPEGHGLQWPHTRWVLSEPVAAQWALSAGTQGRACTSRVAEDSVVAADSTAAAVVDFTVAAAAMEVAGTANPQDGFCS